jgi:hypothetical protein
MIKINISRDHTVLKINIEAHNKILNIVIYKKKEEKKDRETFLRNG